MAPSASCVSACERMRDACVCVVLVIVCVYMYVCARLYVPVFAVRKFDASLSAFKHHFIWAISRCLCVCEFVYVLFLGVRS